MTVPVLIRWRRVYHHDLARSFWDYMVKRWESVMVTERIITQIAAKLERADYYGKIEQFHTVISLILKPGETLTVKDERQLLLLISKRLQSERQYICCNRKWQEGPNFRAFLHVHDFPDKTAFYELLIQGLHVR